MVVTDWPGQERIGRARQAARGVARRGEARHALEVSGMASLGRHGPMWIGLLRHRLAGLVRPEWFGRVWRDQDMARRRSAGVERLGPEWYG